MNLCKRIFCLALVLCAMSTACIAGAAEAVAENGLDCTATINDGPGITPMATQCLIDNAVITGNGRTWYQGNNYTAYRVSVRNTTNQRMKVTVTRNGIASSTFYVGANSTNGISKNDVSAGTYKVSFSVSSGTPRGTFSVWASDRALM